MGFGEVSLTVRKCQKNPVCFFCGQKKTNKTYLNFSHDWAWINLYPCSVSHYQSYKCCSSPKHVELLSLGDHRTSKALIQSKIQLQIGLDLPDLPVPSALKQSRKKNLPGLVNIQIAIENGHRNSGFSHEKWWIFPLLCGSSSEGTLTSDAHISQIHRIARPLLIGKLLTGPTEASGFEGFYYQAPASVFSTKDIL